MKKQQSRLFIIASIYAQMMGNKSIYSDDGTIRVPGGVSYNENVGPNPIFFPQRKKFKGFQRENRRK